MRDEQDVNNKSLPPTPTPLPPEGGWDRHVGEKLQLLYDLFLYLSEI
jgi:hypothetical protein